MNALLKKLDGVLPYTLVRGNHDTRDGFDATFVGTGYDRQISESGGRFSADSLLNTYLTFRAGETEYLVINIDYEASADRLM